MIAYKKSDVIMEDDLGASYCGYVKGDVPVSSDAAEERQKRQVAFPQTSAAQKATKRDTCPLLLVADYRFFKNMGQGSLSRTTNYLIGLIDRVDSLYRKTNFSNGFTGMGFEIKEMRIHQHPTAVSPGSIHYNMEADAWQTRELLETFSRDSRFKKFCLAHLFTHQAFEGGVLGLAYIGSSRTYSVGGVCSPAYYKGGYQLFLNTGWSSSLNRYNRRLLTSEADLVTTHEFGHNWGSEHDPDTSECSPSTKDGGKHIMYTYSVSGYEPNNKMFSPCSKRAMGAVLLSKSKSCFTEKSSGFCGNFEVEEGEECDVGLGVQSDPCCSDECKLRPGAKCSDLNHICCDGCQVADNQKICHEAKNGSCEAEGRCSGISLTCPPPPHKPDGTACLDRGECRSGQCLSMCESQGMVSCICESKENDQDESKKKLDNSCQYCCKKNSNSPCEPFTGPDGMLIDLDDGIPCARGFCHQGTCEQQVQDLVERFWDIIENISPSDLVQFMRANIVGTIIVLSLVIWVPASCLVSYIDRKRRREEEDEQYWHSPENKDLYQWEQPVINIKRAENLRYRPSLRVQIPPPGSYSSTGPRSVYV
ncbi:hypothetical protein CAPTEDRAFT_157290 [Capitella teleta]|uniref:Disintegrin domain-containing protein n=1 Tax=Capitella teleta TaxID=283909 RepID=R7V606_CAPTE|nr:hypothetical protein CAPTEDRAFT_157290 [Capitella teleta]|eukprot:ELU11170.1 hypothetical protein CAPTEDRAFT_157290 [Capitella teleta]